VERFNRTLENIISKYQETRQTNRYIDVLNDIVFNYNNTYHRGIHDTPENKHSMNTNAGTLSLPYYYSKIKIGTKVRLINPKETFQKGYKPKNSKTVYDVVDGNGYSFILKDPKNHILPTRYKGYELITIPDLEVYKDEYQSVIREKTLTNRQKRMYKEIAELEKHTIHPDAKRQRLHISNTSKRKLSAEELIQLKKKTKLK
jgi:hypothetical protein